MPPHKKPSAPKIKQPPVLFSRTQRVIKDIATDMDGVFVSYWNNAGGCVCGNDVLAIYEMLEKLGRQNRIYLFIKSHGGDGQAALRIVHLLRQYVRNIVALVPSECASAATMIALGANEIRMGPMAFLTAVDTSLTHQLSPIDRDNERVSVSLNELTRVIDLWRKEKGERTSNPYQTLFEYVHPLVIGAVDRAESLSIMLCREILAYHIRDDKKVARIAETLNGKYPSHSYPILLQEAKKVGLAAKPLDSTIHDKLLALNEIYSEIGQSAITDYDDSRYHNNEILNIIETGDLLLYYQVDKDLYYRKEERRWVSMNDESCWRRIERSGRKIVRSRFHVA